MLALVVRADLQPGQEQRSCARGQGQIEAEVALALHRTTEHPGDHKRCNKPKHTLQLLNHEQYVAVEVVVEPTSL